MLTSARVCNVVIHSIIGCCVNLTRLAVINCSHAVLNQVDGLLMDCWIIILDTGRLTSCEIFLLIISLCKRVGYPATYMHTHW